MKVSLKKINKQGFVFNQLNSIIEFVNNILHSDPEFTNNVKIDGNLTIGQTTLDEQTLIALKNLLN